MHNSKELLVTLYSMVMLVEARDGYTGGHLWRVSRLSYVLAKALELPEEEAQCIALSGFLHDLGKVGVPDAVLNKHGTLSNEEYQILRTHPAIGAEVLAAHPLASVILDGVIGHHERPDGKGYPRGLKGAEIPLMARVVAIADAFDAMTSSRPYREGMAIARALAIIETNLGTQFDLEAGRCFLSLAKTGELEQIVGHSEPGVPLLRCPICGPIMAASTCLQVETGTFLCPGCTAEYRLDKESGRHELVATGQFFPVEAKVPRVDHGLIDALISDIRFWAR